MNLRLKPVGQSAKHCLSLNIKPELIALVIVAGEQRSKDYIIQDKDIGKSYGDYRWWMRSVQTPAGESTCRGFLLLKMVFLSNN